MFQGILLILRPSSALLLLSSELLQPSSNREVRCLDLKHKAGCVYSTIQDRNAGLEL